MSVRDTSSGTTAAAKSASGALGGKVQDHHRERLAVVYVRQSTPRQVIENRESTRLQYALADRAIDLGWHRDRVLVIDEDLGQSGSSIENRPGFQRLMAEIALDHVGLELGLQVSRLARSCKDWYHLLELCGVFRALLADHDSLYDPARSMTDCCWDFKA
jgi:DNA invertase Pin-like site-specific DNA recombinase